MEIAHEKMTIVYNKFTNDVNFVYEDEQKAELIWGANYEAYSQIYDLLVLDYDKDIFRYIGILYISDGQLKLKDSETLQKYI